MNKFIKWGGLVILALLLIRFILNTLFSIGTWSLQVMLTFFSDFPVVSILSLIMLVAGGYMLYLKHQANESYKLACQQKSSKKIDTDYFAVPTLKAPAADIVEFMQHYSTEALSSLITQYYTKREVGFGEVGATEFIGSVILAEYEPKLTAQIKKGHLHVFEQQWGPLQFSDFMDTVVRESDVPYTKWSEMCRLLYTVHPTLRNHPCAKQAAVILAEEK